MFDFNLDYILEDDRVKLIPLNVDHFKDLLPYALNEPDIWTYSMVSPAGENNMRQYIEQAIASRKEGREYAFVVYDNMVNTIIGSTRYYDIRIANESLQLGFTWYGKAYQGTGVNVHCKYLLLDFAFEHMKMQRVELRADANNARSIQAMKSIGCSVEGILRKDGKRSDGSRRDSIILSILRDEWYDSLRQHLRQRIECK
jgi:RimJ/RimL family protein N-acetyltransferase